MTDLHIYGIKNCDTMTKALRWLDDHKIAYVFHDYKKEGADPDVIRQAITQKGLENVLNRKGTTWSALPEATKNTMNAETAVKAALENPSLIRRPLMVRDGTVHTGFSAQEYAALFSIAG